MRKNKFIYSLSAVALACIISFSGVGNSYIQVHATSVGIEKGVWNDDVSAWENIRQYIKLFASAYGIYVNPSLETILWGIESHNDFYNFMVSDGYTEEQAEETVHGGGGHVRDGISVDDSGNVTYSDDVCDLFHGYISNSLNQTYGYYTVPTLAVSDLNDLSLYNSETYYNSCMNILNHFVTDDNILFWTQLQFRNSSYCISGYLSDLSDNYFLLTEGYNEWDDGTFNSPSFGKYDGYYKMSVLVYDDKFSLVDGNRYYYFLDGSTVDSGANMYNSALSYLTAYSADLETGSLIKFDAPVTVDGRVIKIFKSVDDLKNYSLVSQSYYYTQNWVNYDASQDNSITLTSSEYQYFSDNSTTIYQNIQNNIDNGGDGLTEQDIQKIVEDTVKNVLDNIPSVGDSDTGDDENGGTGIGAIIEGIGKLFDTILTLIGKLMGVVADFTQSILDLFSGFTTFTDGFSGFLSDAFGFIPAEIWNVIQVGLSLIILLAVIKFLRK